MTTFLPIASTAEAGSCCGTAGSGPTPGRAADVAATFKALSDPTRVRLVAAIAASTAGEVCICDLTEPFDLSQPTLSHHMRILIEAGLVAREQRGRWAYFSLRPDARDQLGDAVAALLPATDAATTAELHR